jgi:nitrogenase molybdenum-iron protein alpha/beta subunit
MFSKPTSTILISTGIIEIIQFYHHSFIKFWLYHRPYDHNLNTIKGAIANMFHNYEVVERQLEDLRSPNINSEINVISETIEQDILEKKELLEEHKNNYRRLGKEGAELAKRYRDADTSQVFYQYHHQFLKTMGLSCLVLGICLATANYEIYQYYKTVQPFVENVQDIKEKSSLELSFLQDKKR